MKVEEKEKVHSPLIDIKKKGKRTQCVSEKK